MPSYKPNNEDAPVAIWKMMKGGTHARIAEALEESSMVKAALADVTASPSSAHARAALIDLLTRATGNCIGQAAVQEIRHGVNDLHLNAEDSTVSVYHVTQPGTAAAIAAAITSAPETSTLFANADGPKLVNQISRMVGRCVGQEIVRAGLGIVSLASKLEPLGAGIATVAAAQKAAKTIAGNV